jgi:adenylate cyclase
MTPPDTPSRNGGPRDVTVRYGDRALPARRGDRLLDAILCAGVEHRHICGGHGFCTSCRVEVLGNPAGLSPVCALERQRLGRDAGPLRLACQCRIEGDVHIRPARPISSRFSPD